MVTYILEIRFNLIYSFLGEKAVTFIFLNLIINAFVNWQHCFISLSTTCAVVQVASHFKKSCKACKQAMHIPYFILSEKKVSRSKVE